MNEPVLELDTALEAMTDGVVLFALDGRVLFVNSAEARITGFPDASAMMRDLAFFRQHFELMELDGRILPVSDWPVSRVLGGETIRDWELRGRRKDTGREWFFSFSGALVRGRDGEPARALLITRDVTARKRTEVALHETESKFRQTFDNAAVGIALVAPEGRFLEVNDRLCSITGYPREELLALDFQRLTHPDDLGKDLAFAREVAAGKRRTYSLEKRYLRKGGGEVWIELTVSAQTNSDGSFRNYISVIQDLSLRKQAEEALREAEQQFRILANSIPQLAWIAEGDGAIHWYNRRWYEYTGTTLAEMEDEGGWGWKKVHDPRELPRVVERFQQAVSSGEPWEDTFPLRRHDGEFRWHLSRAMPVRDARGRIVRWFGTNTDVEDQRRQAAELREAVEARDAFLAVASHELRTPLTALLLQLQLRLRLLPQSGAVEAAAVRADLQPLIGHVGRLSRLVNELLDVSRMASGQLQLRPEAVELPALLRDVVSRLQPAAARAGCELRLRAPERCAGVWDRLRLEQVCSNLLSNAVKYGPGKPIEIALECGQRVARLSVRDQGIGIAPEVLPRLFEKFARGVSDRHYGGLGLGLYLVRQIVTAMGGTVDVSSAPGQGATFTVELPL